MWKSYNPNKEAVLVRNPYFKVWNPDAQPEGYPDQIIEKYGLQVSDEVTQVENGQADEVFDGDVIPADRLNRAEQPQVRRPGAREPAHGRLVHGAQHQTPPFNNLKARQAINYAADRAALRQDRRRLVARRADLPDPAAELPRLRAVLPVHRERCGRQQVDGTRHRQGQAARPAVRHGRA